MSIDSESQSARKKRLASERKQQQEAASEKAKRDAEEQKLVRINQERRESEQQNRDKDEANRTDGQSSAMTSGAREHEARKRKINDELEEIAEASRKTRAEVAAEHTAQLRAKVSAPSSQSVAQNSIVKSAVAAINAKQQAEKQAASRNSNTKNSKAKTQKPASPNANNNDDNSKKHQNIVEYEYDAIAPFFRATTVDISESKSSHKKITSSLSSSTNTQSSAKDLDTLVAAHEKDIKRLQAELEASLSMQNAAHTKASDQQIREIERLEVLLEEQRAALAKFESSAQSQASAKSQKSTKRIGVNMATNTEPYSHDDLLFDGNPLSEIVQSSVPRSNPLYPSIPVTSTVVIKMEAERENSSHAHNQHTYPLGSAEAPIYQHTVDQDTQPGGLTGMEQEHKRTLPSGSDGLLPQRDHLRRAGHVAAQGDRWSQLLEYIKQHPAAQFQEAYKHCDKENADHIIVEGAGCIADIPRVDAKFQQSNNPDGTLSHYDVQVERNYTGPVFMPRLSGFPPAPVNIDGKQSFDILMYKNGQIDFEHSFITPEGAPPAPNDAKSTVNPAIIKACREQAVSRHQGHDMAMKAHEDLGSITLGGSSLPPSSVQGSQNSRKHSI